MIISETISIQGDLKDIYGAFCDLTLWTKILPDIKNAEILYDDHIHQEFLMTVERPAGLETIRGVRYCHPFHTLEVFHPVPPPGVKYMRGKWHFIPDNQDIVDVIATRDFELITNNPAAENEFAEKLKNYLKTNLNLFKAAIENK
ncbi:MAG: hypothetical protein K0S08_701 [Gammaproteobacteria bacterium]|nr:hypothetical protein [Gammaproteobacteria bacterium]